MARKLLPTPCSYSLLAVGFGFIAFGGFLAAMLCMLDLADTDKDVEISQDYGQYWLGIPAFLLGIYVLFTRNQASSSSKYIGFVASVYCLVTSVICIVLEAPDWMRYLSDNRSPDHTCKLALIAIPGLHQEMANSEFTCSRRRSYAWTVSFVMASAVCLINFSLSSALVHCWIIIRDQMVYTLPDYPAFTCSPPPRKNSRKKSCSKNSASAITNRAFMEET